MIASELKQKYLDFFVAKGHKILPNVSLIPENDPTALFISAGMHPLVPYLLGEPHSLGKRLVGVQRCLRTVDIDEVGDKVHHTFFEMLGNWSLGDYWKREAVEWSFEFLVSKEWLGIEKEKLAVSVFAGDGDAPFDKESYDVWSRLGISGTRIVKLPKENNWWGPAGETGPCGPDTEVFVWTGEGTAPEQFDPNDSNWVEIWNNVFMEYEKKMDGTFESLKQKNVDTGMGVERTLAILNGLDDDYKTDLFWPIIEKIVTLSHRGYDTEFVKPTRVVADHVKAAVFVAVDGVVPSNTGQGYILRRLVRRAVRKSRSLGVDTIFTPLVIDSVIDIYCETYPELKNKREAILIVLAEEEKKFQTPLARIEQYRIDLEMAIKHGVIKKIKDAPILSEKAMASGAYVYENFQSYGVPPDLSREIIDELGLKFNQLEYDESFRKHQELSRTASIGMFKGGLADNSETATHYHTATHLLQAALRQVLGEHVEQKGSNITAERLRFDFSHTRKMTEEEVKQVEDLVNQQISQNLPVRMEIVTIEEAKKQGALALFVNKYGEQVKVYSIGDFSKEVCGGPHADFTGSLGKFKIIKEEAAGAGIRRVYATLE